MTGQPMNIVLTAPYFGSSFQIAILNHFRKLLNPDQMSFRSSTGEIDKQTTSFEKILYENKPTVLIAISMAPNQDIVALYRSSNVPIILIDEEAKGTTTIATDNIAGGQIAAEHLISRGKKKIAIVNGRPHPVGTFTGNYCARLRLDGFRDTVRRHGMSIPAGGTIEVPNYSREDGVAAMPGLIAAGVDAIFCAAADNTAVGLLTVAKERGIRVPEEIAVVGFDDLPIALLSSPPLTTIKQPMKEIVDAAYTMVTGRQEEILQNPKKVLFKPELVVRKSA